MLISVEVSTQPSSTSFVTGNVSENSQSFWIHASIPSWNCRTIALNLAGQPNFAIILQSPSRLTVSNALVRSTKVMLTSKFCSMHFYWSCLAEIMSSVPLSFPNPHWLYGRSPDCSKCLFNRFSRTLTMLYPAIDNKEMPRWLSQTWFSYRLNR